MKNAVGRELPSYIEGYGPVRPFAGAHAPVGRQERAARPAGGRRSGGKLLPSIEEAIKRTGLRDGMTVSFHHHLRNGDRVTVLVMEAIARLGLKDIRVAASGLFACHDPLAELIDRGVITGMTFSTISRGKVAQAISGGRLKQPAVLMTHGGRARSIAAGELHIDVAFIAAPSCDEEGNASGRTGPSACGMLSYACADARYADQVVVVTDTLEPYPLHPAQICQTDVDWVVRVDAIGDPGGIAYGPTRVSADPESLAVARSAAELLRAAGYIKPGMSLQTGAGGISLAVAGEVGRIMEAEGVTGSFALGGITAPLVDMLHRGLFRALLDTQCFDAAAIRSVAEDGDHVVISAEQYADPAAKSCAVERLDIMILGATELDLDFNLNVITGSDGAIMSAAGGNSDCAAGAKVAVVVSKLVKGGYCLARDRVTTVTTPGETVDVLVTDFGIAVNPRRGDLLEMLRWAGIETVDIARLKELGEERADRKARPRLGDRIVGVVEYRDGSVIDVVRQKLDGTEV